MTDAAVSSNERGAEKRERPLAAAVVIATVAFACYLPSLSSEFVRLDDYQYVIDNELVRSPGWSGIRRFFAEVRNPSTVAGYYQPLTMTSLCVDVLLSGADAERVEPFIFHLTNALLHALTAVLVFTLFRSASGNMLFSALAAALFAVHPANVESVAWISQRKTVLATPLAIGSILAYLRWGSAKRYGWLILSFVLYLLANLAKPTVVLLPLVLLFLDKWPLHRAVGRSLVEKWPFAAGMLAFAYIAFVSQSQSEANMGVPNLMSGAVILKWGGLLCYNVMLYLGNIVWPLYLSPVRSVPESLSLAYPPIALSCLGVIGLMGLWLCAYRTMPSFFVGLAAFAILLSPAMGPIRFVGSCVSDRFLYLPLIFLLLPLVELCKSWSDRQVIRPGILCGIFASAIATMGGLAIVQQSVWANSRNLWTRVEAMSPDDPIALSNLAVFDIQEGRIDDALRRAEHAVDVAPGDANSLHTLGRVYARLGRGGEAVGLIREALEIGLGPSQGAGHVALAQACLADGDNDASRAAFDRALELGCTPALAASEMADFALRVARRPDEAVRYYQIALEDDPDDIVARWNLGTALEFSGRAAEALTQYEIVRAAYAARGDAMPDSLAGAIERLGSKLKR